MTSKKIKESARRVAIGYCRVSTPGQAAKGVSLQVQAAAIKRLCQAKGWQLAETYSDRGKSGRKLRNRPQLAKALDAVCAAKGVLVVYSVSRMSRSLADVFTLTQRLDRSGAELVSVSEPIDTTGAIGRAFFAVVAVIAQLESELTGERVAATIQHQVERYGHRIDGQQPLGYRLRGKRRVSVDREQRVLALIRQWRAKRWTYAAIARELNRRRALTYWRLRKYRGVKRKAVWHGRTVSKLVKRMLPRTRHGGAGKAWSEAELALLGTDTDAAVASQIARRLDVVSRKRRAMRIRAYDRRGGDRRSKKVRAKRKSRG